MQTYDYRYRCVGCRKEFTLHSAEPIDPIEFDPACPWCDDLTGLPCYVPTKHDSGATIAMAGAQAVLMSEVVPKQYGPQCNDGPCKGDC